MNRGFIFAAFCFMAGIIAVLLYFLLQPMNVPEAVASTARAEWLWVFGIGATFLLGAIGLFFLSVDEPPIGRGNGRH